MHNTLKTGVLLVLLAAILLAIGGAVGGRSGVMIALILAFGLNAVSYWFSDKIVLRLYGAQEVSEAEAPQLYGILRRLAQRAQIPMPRVYLIATETPNAFATGRNPSMLRLPSPKAPYNCWTNGSLKGYWHMNWRMSKIAIHLP